MCIYGVPAPKDPLPVQAQELFMREITVLTSFSGATEQTMTEAIAAVRQDEIFFEKLLGNRITLQELPKELTEWNPLPGTRTIVDMNV